MDGTYRLIYLLLGFFSILLLISVLWLFKRKSLGKSQFFLWLCISVALIVMAFIPSTLEALTVLLGLSYTYVAIIVIGFPLVILLCLALFIKLTELNKTVIKLAQEVAILEYYKDKNIKKEEKT